MSYDHRQIGRLVVVFCVPAMVLLIALVAAGGFSWIAASVLLLFALILLLFSALRVQVDDQQVRLEFGIGLVRKTFAVHDIVEARPVRNRWWYGWGIRLTPHGWLFNVSGLDAVEIMLRSGKRYRIGTDEPQALERALQRAMAAS